MRIPLFPKHITRHETKLALLKNCPVVIDGHNFFYNMYEESGIPFVFGCESDKFAEYLKTRLHMFKESNVQCYIVFKGGDTSIDKKIKRLAHSDPGELFDVADNCFVAPMLMLSVVKQVLDEMGIKYVVCLYESKRDCAALAEWLSCPVITDDCEFCFMQVPYINKFSLKYNTAINAIECKQFKLEDFLVKYSFTKREFAIFAVLADLHTFPTGHFNGFLKTWKLLDVQGKLSFFAIFNWLSRYANNDPISRITHFLKKEDVEKFFSELQKVLMLIETKKESLIVDYFCDGCNVHIASHDPEWFEKGVVCKNIPPRYVNLYKANCFVSPSVIEGLDNGNSIFLAIDIIKYAYNLLTNFTRDQFTVLLGGKKTQVTVNNSVPKPTESHAFENGWVNIKDKALFEHFFIQNSIDVNLIRQVSDEAAMLVITLVYFARKKMSKNVNVNKEVYCILIGFVMLANKSKEEYGEAFKTTESYFNTTQKEINSIFNRNLLHTLVEFQHCLEKLNDLNTLCGVPFMPTIYHSSFNGTVVYKLFHELVNSDLDCRAFTNKVFGCCKPALNNVNMLIGFYEKLYAN